MRHWTGVYSKLQLRAGETAQADLLVRWTLVLVYCLLKLYVLYPIQPSRGWHCGRLSSADFGVEVAHYEQHVPLGDLFNCSRQVLVEPLHFFLCSCCRWFIHWNHSNILCFRIESHNNESVADWFMSDKCSSDFPMSPDCHS